MAKHRTKQKAKKSDARRIIFNQVAYSRIARFGRFVYYVEDEPEEVAPPAAEMLNEVTGRLVSVPRTVAGQDRSERVRLDRRRVLVREETTRAGCFRYRIVGDWEIDRLLEKWAFEGKQQGGVSPAYHSVAIRYRQTFAAATRRSQASCSKLEPSYPSIESEEGYLRARAKLAFMRKAIRTRSTYGDLALKIIEAVAVYDETIIECACKLSLDPVHIERVLSEALGGLGVANITGKAAPKAI